MLFRSNGWHIPYYVPVGAERLVYVHEGPTVDLNEITSYECEVGQNSQGVEFTCPVPITGEWAWRNGDQLGKFAGTPTEVAQFEREMNALIVALQPDLPTRPDDDRPDDSGDDTPDDDQTPDNDPINCPALSLTDAKAHTECADNVAAREEICWTDRLRDARNNDDCPDIVTAREAAIITLILNSELLD